MVRTAVFQPAADAVRHAAVGPPEEVRHLAAAKIVLRQHLAGRGDQAEPVAVQGRKRGERCAPGLRRKEDRRRIFQTALTEIPVDQSGSVRAAARGPVALACVAEADRVRFKVHHVHFREIASAVGKHMLSR